MSKEPNSGHKLKARKDFDNSLNGLYGFAVEAQASIVLYNINLGPRIRVLYLMGLE